jgi:hypothetical protein
LHIVREYYQDQEIKEWVSREDLYSDNQEKQDLLQSWIVGLARPWSASAEFFHVSRNCTYDGTIVEEREAWKATYTSIFYDTMESVIVAYGPNTREALASAEKILDEMVAIYEERYATCDYK